MMADSDKQWPKPADKIRKWQTTGESNRKRQIAADSGRHWHTVVNRSGGYGQRRADSNSCPYMVADRGRVADSVR